MQIRPNADLELTSRFAQISLKQFCLAAKHLSENVNYFTVNYPYVATFTICCSPQWVLDSI